tara:strand:- start:556 stop:1401 length:846 start_codon:yes stop_codon:yes gene_type:complete
MHDLLWKTFKRTIQAFFTGNGLFMASGLAFNLLLYCMPLSLLLISVGGYTVVGSDRTIEWINESWETLMPTSQLNITESFANIADNRKVFGVTGFLLYFVLSSTVFGTARLVLNSVLNTPSQKSFVQGTLRDFVMMLGLSLLMIIMIFADMLISVLRVLGEEIPVIHEFISHGWVVVSQGMGFFLIAVLFYLFYQFLPERRMSQKALIIGSVIGAGLFELSRWAFAGYVSAAQTFTVMYGALGGLIFFFFWLYYASCVFILGAIAGSTYEKVFRPQSVSAD